MINNAFKFERYYGEDCSVANEAGCDFDVSLASLRLVIDEKICDPAYNNKDT